MEYITWDQVEGNRIKCWISGLEIDITANVLEETLKAKHPWLEDVTTIKWWEMITVFGFEKRKS